jgi:DNA-binding NarL/FixJ family response regulator
MAVGKIMVTVHDDDPLSRAGVVALLRNQSEMIVVEDPGAAEENRAASVAVIIVDLLDETTVGQLRKLVVDRKKRVVLVTKELDEEQIQLVVDAGVQNIVWRRHATVDQIAKAVHIASLGKGMVPSDLLPCLLEQMRRTRHDDRANSPVGAELTEREIAVLRLAAEGSDTKEIAERLSYSERTVKGLLHDLMVRMRLRNRTQAVAFAVREGYI